MCTASNFITKKGTFFGRNYDYEKSFDEQATIVPRGYKFKFRDTDDINDHYAIMGITAGLASEYPLFYDATNEFDLSMAGLNFEGNARYFKPKNDMVNVASFELIPYILGQCTKIEQVKELLEDVNITNRKYSYQLPPSPLHWMVSDANGDSIVIESTENGLQVYNNPFGVLTNNPTFDKQQSELNKYIGLSVSNPSNTFSNKAIEMYSRGMGAIGLPGDYSSTSRFVKCAFVRENATNFFTDYGNVVQFFHILSSVEQVKGLTQVGSDYEYTIYSSCYHDGRLFYKLYEHSAIVSIGFLDGLCDLDYENIYWSKLF